MRKHLRWPTLSLRRAEVLSHWRDKKCNPLALKPLVLAAIFSVVAVIPCWPREQTRTLQIEGERATFTTENLIAVVQNGVLVRLFNRLIGTEYILATPGTIPRDFLSAMLYAVPEGTDRGQTAKLNSGAGNAAFSKLLSSQALVINELPRVSSRKADPLGLEYLYESGDRQTSFAVKYSLDPNSGDLVVQQRGNGKCRGLSGLRLGLGPITCRGNLLFPAFNGIKASRGSLFKYESTSWQWPMGWQMPLIIFDHPLGGFWVHTQDPQGRFKALHYRYEGAGTWNIALDTSASAPFHSHESAVSVQWRINTYQGTWTVPMDHYKLWAYSAYRMAEKERLRPTWVDEIRLEIRDADHVPQEQITEYLNLLSEHVDPAQTLLFLTRWTGTNMVDDKDVVVPRWVAGEYGIQFNREARKRGFRTMYFTNYFGITSNHPRLEEFRSCFLRNPYTHEVEGWNLKGEWSSATTLKLYYVNPACKRWRDYQVSQLKVLFEGHPADALFLDQAYHMYNDDNGPIDGLTSVEGNLALHRDVAEALPGVALAGESVNEISMQYESFCELHLLSMYLDVDSQGKATDWRIDPEAFDRMVPLVTRYLLPHTRLLGSFALPDAGNAFYPGYRDALRLYGGIPALTRPAIADVRDPQSEVRRVMQEAMAGK